MLKEAHKTLTYTQACRYAAVISRDRDPKDLVHTAYLYHHELTGGNMFDQPKGYVLRCVKNAWRRRYRATQYIFRGELITTEYFDISRLEIAGGITPERALMSKEFVDAFHRKIDTYKKLTGRPIHPTALKDFLWYLEEGYTMPEITKEMKMSQTRLHHYKTKLKSIASEMREYIPHNPFNVNEAGEGLLVR